jgi:hypothetical protein
MEPWRGVAPPSHVSAISFSRVLAPRIHLPVQDVAQKNGLVRPGRRRNLADPATDWQGRASVSRLRRGRNLKWRIFILPIRGRPLILFLKPVLWSCGRLPRPLVSCGPTLLAPSLKVQRDRIHNPPPGTTFLPWGWGFTDGTLTKEIRLKNQRRARGFSPALSFCGPDKPVEPVYRVPCWLGQSHRR